MTMFHHHLSLKIIQTMAIQMMEILIILIMMESKKTQMLMITQMILQ
jgi:hypothetical protein